MIAIRQEVSVLLNWSLGNTSRLMGIDLSSAATLLVVEGNRGERQLMDFNRLRVWWWRDACGTVLSLDALL